MREYTTEQTPKSLECSFNRKMLSYLGLGCLMNMHLSAIVNIADVTADDFIIAKIEHDVRNLHFLYCQRKIKMEATI